MRRKTIRLIAAALALVACPAAAQVPPGELGARYVPAPWWMRDPVIASMGSVHADLPANRASFMASFTEYARDPANATELANRRSRELDAALRRHGAQRVQFTTTFNTRPIFEQYRDEQGNLRPRPDRIERYEVTGTVMISILDVAVIEPVYATVLAARPTTVSPVQWSLLPDSETLSRMAVAAAQDARGRAAESARAVGAALGAVKIVDPSGRVCATDVLAGWQSYAGSPTASRDVSERFAMAAPPPPPPPPPPPGAGAGEQINVVTLRPPLQRISDTACVIYAIN